MSPFKQIRSLLAGLGTKGRKGAKKFPHPPPLQRRWQISSISSAAPYAEFLTDKLSIKRHRVAFMRVFFFFSNSLVVRYSD